MLSTQYLVAGMPVTPETLTTRFKPTAGNVIYKDFVSFIVSGVVGIRHFDRHKLHSRYCIYVTVSNEAFAVLTIGKSKMLGIRRKGETLVTTFLVS
jgi:hypothetical protein